MARKGAKERAGRRPGLEDQIVAAGLRQEVAELQPRGSGPDDEVLHHTPPVAHPYNREPLDVHSYRVAQKIVVEPDKNQPGLPRNATVGGVWTRHWGPRRP